MLYRTWSGADSQSRTVDSDSEKKCHTRHKTLSPLDFPPHSSGSTYFLSRPTHPVLSLSLYYKPYYLSARKRLSCLLPFPRLFKINIDLGGWKIGHGATGAVKSTEQQFKPPGRVLFEKGLTTHRAYTRRDAADNHFNLAASAGKTLTHPGKAWTSRAVPGAAST